MSEKNTDYYMQKAYELVFKHEYHTETNSELFDSLIPDGWDIINDTLIIIENKRLIKDKTKGRDQLFNYYDNIKDNKYQTYLILGLGCNKKSFRYVIYDSNKNETTLTLDNIYDSLHIKPKIDEKEIRDLNQYLYDNSITLSKSQKTLFIASVLLCLKIDDKILDGYDESTNSFLIADKMIDIITTYYDDSLFSNMFYFIKKSIHNKHLYHVFSVIKNDIKLYGKDILNQFYSDFCVWDRNNDGKMGIVLTPDDIVDLMVTKSFDYYYQFNKEPNPKVIDFCTGTGSFLIKCSKFTNSLYGCECGDERYSLCKCNFILNELDVKNLSYGSCFNINYQSDYFDISIINPPFSNKCKDELNPNNNTNWKSYTKEQRFIMYQVELLKENGIGCCIVPRSNFNNTIKSVNEFKKKLMNYCQILEVINCNSKVFVPNANVECTILIFRKYDNKQLNNYQTKIIDYSDDGYKVKKNIRLFDHKPVIREQFKVLKSTDDWNYYNEFNIIQDDILSEMINEYNNNYIHSFNKYIINKNLVNKERNKITFNEVIKITKLKEWKEFKISDLMDLLPNRKLIGSKETPKGQYPLISTGQNNHGIIRYINNYEYDGENHRYITCAMTGSSGSSFYQPFKFMVTDRVRVLEIKKDIDINPHLISLIMNYSLINKYSYTNGLTIDKILNETVNIPIFE